jgi:hypothetical protein
MTVSGISRIDDFEGPVYFWYPNGNMGRFSPNGGNWT